MLFKAWCYGHVFRWQAREHKIITNNITVRFTQQ